jgi:hypothetical protein
MNLSGFPAAEVPYRKTFAGLWQNWQLVLDLDSNKDSQIQSPESELTPPPDKPLKI